MKQYILILCGAWLYLTSAEAADLFEEDTAPPLSRSIIDMFLNMKLIDQKIFCRNVVTASLFVEKKLTSYGVYEEDFPEYNKEVPLTLNYYSYGNCEWGNKTGRYASDSKLSAFEKNRIILEILNLYPEEFKEVDSYVLYTSKDTFLPLKTYLKFCIDVNPGLNNLEPAFLITHQVTESWGLDPMVRRRDKNIQDLTWKIARPFREPFGLRPLNITAMQRDFNELNRYIQKAQISSTFPFKAPFFR